ncbi:hypothetical protein MTDSW087_05822 [Methylobacterium dankookense]|uniref:Uncharacterized protein n=1 Tax=Methylobacterium dankookense TaxID=560405 RepID=A0A564G951_9HYPH|nr:hypothetical protein IFDJLNFL_0627 [Methylobacterium dankookense]VUF16071.1 hypothetical protein MTDSW087_05822 [Methylobacterium dankookense]
MTAQIASLRECAAIFGVQVMWGNGIKVVFSTAEQKAVI